MPIPGSLGTILLYTWPGNPTNVSVTEINPPLGALVIDTTTPAIWQKTTALGDNSGYSGVAGSTFTAPLISGGLTASGSASNDFSGSTGTFKTSTGAGTLSGTTTLAANKNLLCTTGTSLFDFSLGTGIFKTSTGLNTFGGKAAFKVIATPVAAAGNATGNAAALGSANILAISSDSAAKGVRLVTGVAGDVVEIINTTATAAILYPASGGTINGLSADAGVLIPASKGTLAICTAADTWTTYDLAAKSTAA